MIIDSLAIQIVSFLTYSCSIVFLCFLLVKKTIKTEILVPLIIVVIHSFIYYSLIIASKSGFRLLTGIDFHSWSPIQRLHSSFTILGILIILLFFGDNNEPRIS
jgi:hypothetical protein